MAGFPFTKEQPRATLAAGVNSRFSWAGIQRAAMSMASIAQGGVTLPTWFLTAATIAFLAATGSIVKMEWDLASTVNTDHDQIQRNTTAIDRLMALPTDIASMKADLSAAKATADRTEAKVDRLIDRQLDGRRP